MNGVNYIAEVLKYRDLETRREKMSKLDFQVKTKLGKKQNWRSQTLIK